MEVSLPSEFEDRLKQIVDRYPHKESAVMPALYLAQEHFGHINNDAIHWVAPRVGMAPVKVMEIATFYTMFHTKEVGRYHFQVCRTLPCALRGAGALTGRLKERFKLNAGGVSECGRWSFEEVECLGSCGTAPMCQINDRFFENLTVEEMDRIISELETQDVDLKLSTLKDSLGTGMSQYSVSQLDIPSVDKA
jgi:NADH-quinone oxidoreductase subunit E